MTTLQRIERAANDRLLELAAGYSLEIQRIIARAARQAGDAADVAAAAAALAAGNLEGALAALGIAQFDAVLEQLRPQIEAAIRDAAAREIAKINRGALGRAVFVFDAVDPATVSWIRRYELDLIREIGAKTREGIRTGLVDGLSRGLNPITTARQVRPTIGLTGRQAQAVANFRRELEIFHERRSAGGWNLGGAKSKRNGRGVMVIDQDGNPVDGITERRLRDFRYDPTLRRAMQSGKPLSKAQIDQMVDAYARRWLKYRAETIARTESLRAANVGAREGWRQAIERGAIDAQLVRRRWLTAQDERVRLSHRPIPRMNPGPEGFGIGFDQPFATPDGQTMGPPHGPNCRCTLIYRMIEPEMLGRPLGPLASR